MAIGERLAWLQVVRQLKACLWEGVLMRWLVIKASWSSTFLFWITAILLVHALPSSTLQGCQTNERATWMTDLLWEKNEK